ncbi:sulfate ABC transporter substrate-binding protein, partial [Leptospira borgpetersenii serovar Hardjo-bovis]|nr:sulfate ABC transporter substrate-binding protein [Leptospira borgpetersenii serovar Hardjo-bovis]
MKIKFFKITTIVFFTMTSNLGLFAKDITLLNVSYD